MLYLTLNVTDDSATKKMRTVTTTLIDQYTEIMATIRVYGPQKPSIRHDITQVRHGQVRLQYSMRTLGADRY